MEVNIDEKLIEVCYRQLERCIEVKKILSDEHVAYKILSEDDEDKEMWLSDFLTYQDISTLQGVIDNIIERDMARCEITIRTASMRLGRLPVFPSEYKAVN